MLNKDESFGGFHLCSHLQSVRDCRVIAVSLQIKTVLRQFHVDLHHLQPRKTISQKLLSCTH